MYYNYEIMQRVILPACSAIKGKPILKFTAIMDLNGIGMTDLMSKNVYNMVSMGSKMVQEYYPEIVHKSYIINTPMLFSGFFAVVKPILSSRTQEALSLPGGKFKKELAEAIDAQFLPIEYGGTNPNKPEDCIDRGEFVPYIKKAHELKKWDHTPEDFEEKKTEVIQESVEIKPQVAPEEPIKAESSANEGDALSKVDSKVEPTDQAEEKGGDQ